ARDVACARQMLLLELVAFADVEEDEVAAAALEAIAQLVEAHERQTARRLRHQLTHRFTAGAVRPERLAQVLGHGEIETAHELDERAALLLLQARVSGLLGADRRRGASFVVVRREDVRRVVETQELAEETLVQRLGVARRE